MRSEGYGLSVCVCVCVCVCVSVKRHLTSGASVRPEIDIAYSAGNEGQKFCGVFSETAPLRRSSTPAVDGHVWSAIFPRKAENAHAYLDTQYISHVVKRTRPLFPVVLAARRRRLFTCEF